MLRSWSKGSPGTSLPALLGTAMGSIETWAEEGQRASILGEKLGSRLIFCNIGNEFKSNHKPNNSSEPPNKSAWVGKTQQRQELESLCYGNIPVLQVSGLKSVTSSPI